MSANRRASPYRTGVTSLHDRRIARGRRRTAASRQHSNDDCNDGERITRTRDDTRRGAATRGTATRGDAFPLAATEQLSEHRGRESVSPHHTCRTTAAAAVATSPTTARARVPLGRARFPSRLPGYVAAASRRRASFPCPTPLRTPNFKAVKDALSPRAFAMLRVGPVNALRGIFVARRLRISYRTTARAQPSSQLASPCDDIAITRFDESDNPTVASRQPVLNEKGTPVYRC